MRGASTFSSVRAVPVTTANARVVKPLTDTNGVVHGVFHVAGILQFLYAQH